MHGFHFNEESALTKFFGGTELFVKADFTVYDQNPTVVFVNVTEFPYFSTTFPNSTSKLGKLKSDNGGN